MTQARFANPLQPVINGWLRAAAENLTAPSETAQHASLPALSLRKRQKHTILDNSADFAHQQLATHRVLATLAHSVLEISLRDYNPTENYPFYCLSQPQNSLVSSSFILSPSSLLCAENLATLQLSDWQATNRAGRQLRKRTGSFYTSPPLARYITARVGVWSQESGVRSQNVRVGGWGSGVSREEEAKSKEQEWEEKESGVRSQEAERGKREPRANLSPNLSSGSQTAPKKFSDNRQSTTDNPLSSFPILDPACGGGVFLLAALDLLHQNNPTIPPQQLLEHQLYGLDLNPAAADLTRLTLLLRLFELAGPLDSEIVYILGRQIRAGNALVGDGKRIKEQGASSKNRERTGQEGEEAGVGSQESEREKREQGTNLSFNLPGGSRTAPTEFSGPRPPTPDPLLSHPSSYILHPYSTWEEAFEQKQAELRQQLANLPIFNDEADGPYLASLGPFGWAAAWPEVFEQGGFGAVVGNPPFVGFNDYSGVEKAYFAQAFPQVYNLKADFFYYFICRGVELLRPGGRLGYVTSRFWKEAVFAARLREWLARSTRLLAIEDQGVVQLFAEAEVDSCLLFLENSPPTPESQLEFSFVGQVQKVEQSGLGHAPWAWLRRLPAEDLLLARLEEGAVRLGELAECRTGVQTGLDEVFIIDPATAARLEPEALRPAIKSGDITAPGQLVWPGQKYLIYLPSNCDLADFPKVAAWLEPHRARLERRLRYRKPFPYWELQWPRTPEVFAAPAKLVSPYKAPRNWLALDTQQLYFSTDIISVTFHPSSFILHPFLLNFLNSSLSTWQFRSYSKQVGGRQYDYYANPLKKLILPPPAALLAYPSLSSPNLSQEEIDTLVFDLYQLSLEEIALIKQI